jgi:glycosyltransferase involved in cell wall biosynthesis
VESGIEIERRLDALREYCDVAAFPIPQEHSVSRLAWDHLRSVLTRRPYTRYLHDSRAYRARLQELLHQQRFDLVHVDSLDLSGYIPLLGAAPIVCTHHNVESQLLHRRARAEANPVRRAYMRLQAGFMEREERCWAARLGGNVMVSAADADQLRRSAPGCHTIVAPNGVDIEEFTVRSGRADSIAFVGGTEWFPNVDALQFFAAEILPLVSGENDTRPAIRWIGRAAKEETRDWAERGVEMTGYVDDVRPWIADALCTIVPLRIGGGTRLKITTAWAMGKAIVSTSVGCEGLDAVDGHNILIRDTPDGFAAAVSELISNSELRERLGRNGRSTVEKTYSWDVIVADLIAHYLRIVDGGNGPDPVDRAAKVDGSARSPAQGHLRGVSGRSAARI